MNQRHVFGTVLTLESIVAGAVFLVVLALFSWALLTRRARTGAVPSARAGHTRLEVFYVSVLAVFAVFLVTWTALHNHREQDQDAGRDPVRVDVTSFQWCWKFGYPQAPHGRSVTGTKAVPPDEYEKWPRGRSAQEGASV